MKNILLATDLASSSDRAMERAAMLAKNLEAQLHILHVAAAYPVPGQKHMPKPFQQAGEDLIRAHLDSYREAGGVNAEITILQGGDVFAHILEQAHKVKADLIVMGVHAKAKFRDLFTGTTVERVIRRGVKPVLVVKNKPTTPYQNIIAGVDFTPGSRAAMRLALEISPKATIRAVHTYDMPVYHSETSYVYVESKALAEKAQKKDLDAFLKTEIAHFKQENNDILPKLTGRIIQGHIPEILIQQVQEAQADMITLGTHGRPGFTISKLGGTAEEILANPPCDVLIARE